VAKAKAPAVMGMAATLAMAKVAKVVMASVMVVEEGMTKEVAAMVEGAARAVAVKVVGGMASEVVPMAREMVARVVEAEAVKVRVVARVRVVVAGGATAEDMVVIEA